MENAAGTFDTLKEVFLDHVMSRTKISPLLILVQTLRKFY